MVGEAEQINRFLRVSFGRSLGPFVAVDGVARRVTFNHIAGQLSLGGAPYLIRPKFMSQVNWTTRLATWARLGYAERPNCFTLLPGPVRAEGLPTGLVDLLALHYLRRVEFALADHPLVSFQRVTRDLSYVRGRLLVGRNLSRLPHEHHRMWCSFTRLEPNIRALQLLAWAAERLERLVVMPDVKQGLRLLLSRLPVEPADVGPVEVASLRLARGAWAYEEPLQMANALARGHSPAVASGAGTRRSASFVVCTFEAFEGVVSAAFAVVAARIDMRHETQRWTTFARRTASPATQGLTVDRGERQLRPDDVLAHDYPMTDPRVLVSDSKYVSPGGSDDEPKLPAVDRGHFYQVVTAAIARSADAALVVQPYPESLPPGRAGLEIFTVQAVAGGLLTRDLRIGVMRLDLRPSVAAVDPLSQLADQVQAAVQHLIG